MGEQKGESMKHKTENQAVEKQTFLYRPFYSLAGSSPALMDDDSPIHLLRIFFTP